MSMLFQALLLVALAQQHARVVDEVPRRKVVAAVDDDVVRREHVERIRRAQPHRVRL